MTTVTAKGVFNPWEILWKCDVPVARINVIASEYQLGATAIVGSKTLFIVDIWADRSALIESRVEP